MPVSDEEQTLNGILAHGTTEYYSSYVQPLVGENTPVFFSEVNSGPFPPLSFESYLYNGIFVAEWVTRMSTIPQVQAVGASALILPNYFSQGMICAVDDYEDYLVEEVITNPNYSTDTSTNPKTQLLYLQRQRHRAEHRLRPDQCEDRHRRFAEPHRHRSLQRDAGRVAIPQHRFPAHRILTL
jgi:hypothetical protein